MKNFASLRKATVFLLSICISVFLFAGCQNSGTSKSTSNTAKSNTQNNNRPSTDQMKQRIQDNIKPLVTAGTITQDQANKIIAAYTTRPGRNGNNNKSQDNKGANQPANTQNRQKFNPLSKLVSDGTITQAQADAVTQKLKGNFTHKNNGQSSN